MQAAQDQEVNQPPMPFVGLAPFLRKSIVGTDLRPIAQALLASAQTNDDPDTLMNLAIAMHCIGNRDFGLAIQGQALLEKRTYLLPAQQQPARCRLLMLMAPGDLAANTPLECLLEQADVDIIQYFLLPQAPCLDDVPPHDVLFVALSEGDENTALLGWLNDALIDWPKPVLNAPAMIPALSRNQVSQALQDIPGLFVPETRRVSRTALQAVAAGGIDLPDLAPEGRFPIILRPVGSQAGRDLERIGDVSELADYLRRVQADLLYLANFIDYSSPDGLFRKARVVLVAGEPFVAHMAVSSDWMVHYVNAGMYVDDWKRQEEARFMIDFQAFAGRHAQALVAIYQQTKLDFLCIDCAETRDGDFLLFEVGNAMVVHAMDPVELFPYKAPIIKLIADAIRRLLFGRMAAQPTR